jgi:cysteinyl-tRNA synthetase
MKRGNGMLLLTNTLTGNKELFVHPHDTPVTMYVCGITPYDYAHIGHGRCYVTFDILYRLLQALGYTVTYCRNFTDIDDKLIARSQKEYGDDNHFTEIAQRFIAAYHRDMRALDCLSPTYEPCVTDNIPAIISFIEKLIKSKHAYVVGGDVYFSIESFPSYGKLSKRDIEDLRAGARVAVSALKKNPLDFALWKSEPEGTFWQSPWGYGRPGWHIECSALAYTYLGFPVDIHGGGMDLIFPHHENEIAQSEALYPTFVKTWVHNAFVRVNQEKMSKSLSNFVTLKDLFERYDPMVIRFLFLQHHYRNPLDFSYQDLEVAQKTYQRLCKIFVQDEPDSAPIIISRLSGVAEKMAVALADDLNTPAMLGILFEHLPLIMADVNERKMVGAFLRHVVGISLIPLPEKVTIKTPAIEMLIFQREEARRMKDWARADALRDELHTLGIDVQDKKIEG